MFVFHRNFPVGAVVAHGCDRGQFRFADYERGILICLKLFQLLPEGLYIDAFSYFDESLPRRHIPFLFVPVRYENPKGHITVYIPGLYDSTYFSFSVNVDLLADRIFFPEQLSGQLVGNGYLFIVRKHEVTATA